MDRTNCPNCYGATGTECVRCDRIELKALRTRLAEVEGEAERRERAERRRADNALAAAAEIGNVLDVIERNLHATRYDSVHAATLDILDLIRVARENARQCYGRDLPQLVDVMNRLRAAEAARAASDSSLTTARGLLGEAVGCIQRSRLLYARITAFLEGNGHGS